MKNTDILFASHYREILQFVYEKGESKRDDIYRILPGSSTTKKNRVDDLIECGFLVEVRYGLHNVKMISLTMEGERICRLLMEIEGGDDRSHPPNADSLPELEKA